MVWVKGAIPWNKGKKFSDKSKLNMRIAHLGKKLTEEQKRKIGLKSLGHKLSSEAKEKISNANSGSNSGSWKGGVSKLSELIRKCSKTREWRLSIFERDDFSCVECGRHGDILHPHHLKLFSTILREFLYAHRHLSPVDDKQKLLMLAKEYSDFWDINNGVTLCCYCHNKKHPNLILSIRK